MINTISNATHTMSTRFEGMLNDTAFHDVKASFISAIILMNVIMNSLVIAVIARYPELREDRTTLFMLSLSVSDLAAGCTFMPISAALCSSATPHVVEITGILPKLHAFTMWWFGFNSMYSLCWLTISKAIVILKPFRCERLLTHICCRGTILLTWVIGGMLATIQLHADISWNIVMCNYRFPGDQMLETAYMTLFTLGCVFHVLIIAYGTLRMFIVVMRTHRHICALDQSVAVPNTSIGNSGFVTDQAIRSSKTIIIICAASILLMTPSLVFSIIRNVTNAPIQDNFGFICIWMFEWNTFVNSMLYLFLYRSVRKKIGRMFGAMLSSMYDRYNDSRFWSTN